MSVAPVRLTYILSLCLALIGGMALAAPGDVGTPAADFNLQVFGGGTQSLSQNSGKVVMLFVIGYG